MPTRTRKQTPALQRLVLWLCVAACLIYGACPLRPTPADGQSSGVATGKGMGPER